MEVGKYFRKYFINLLRFVGMLCTAAVILLLLGPYELAMSNQNEVPKIVTKDGQETLILPKGLDKNIKTRFPGFRVPTRSDMTDYWASEKLPGSFPFITWGDFNGDGQTDVAVILLSDRQWRLVIFHKKDKAFTPAYERGGDINKEGELIQKPQQIILRLVKKEEEWAPEGGDIPMEYKHQFDAIELTIYGRRPPSTIISAPHSLLYWENGKYNEY